MGDISEKRKDFVSVEDDTSYEIAGVQRSGWGLAHKGAVRGDSMKFSKLLRLEAGNLVYRTITAFEAPSTVVLPKDSGKYVTPQAFPVFRLNDKRIMPSFMALITTYPSFHQAMAERCTGTVLRRKTLSVSSFESIPIKLPPLAEQQRIVDLIGSLDDAIEASQTATRQLVRAQSATLASKILSDASPRNTLESVFDHVIGGSWGSPTGEEDVEVNAIGPSAYATGRIDVDPSLGSPRSLSEKRAAVRELKPGDIVLERSGGSPTQPVGRVLRMNSEDKRIVPSDFMRLLRVDASLVEPSYIFWALWSLYRIGASEPFQKYTTGIRNLNIPDYLRATTIHIPEDPEERARIIDLAESMAATVSMARKNTECLRALRSELLSALLSGEHTIPGSYDELMAGWAA